jgi:type I restriction enzyme S subunit
MFGDPVENPKKWDIIQLHDRCDIVTGNTPAREKSEYYGNYIEWIKSDNINTDDVYLTVAEEYLSKKGLLVGRCVEAGSILMTCIAGSIGCIGNVGVANRKVAFNQQINAIVPNKDSNIFIYWLMVLSKKYIQGTVNMSLKGILSKGKLSELYFPFPPIELQHKFEKNAIVIDKSKLAVKKSLEELEILKKSLMQKYFA